MFIYHYEYVKNVEISKTALINVLSFHYEYVQNVELITTIAINVFSNHYGYVKNTILRKTSAIIVCIEKDKHFHFLIKNVFSSYFLWYSFRATYLNLTVTKLYNASQVVQKTTKCFHWWLQSFFSHYADFPEIVIFRNFLVWYRIFSISLRLSDQR